MNRHDFGYMQEIYNAAPDDLKTNPEWRKKMQELEEEHKASVLRNKKAGIEAKKQELQKKVMNKIPDLHKPTEPATNENEEAKNKEKMQFETAINAKLQNSPIQPYIKQFENNNNKSSDLEEEKSGDDRNCVYKKEGIYGGKLKDQDKPSKTTTVENNAGALKASKNQFKK